MNNLEKEDAEVRAEMQRIGHWITDQLPRGWHFALLCAPTGLGGRMNYIANAQRGDVVRLMYEFIEHTKEKFGQHVDREDSTDTELGRLRQKVAKLEGELEQYRTIVEPGSGKGKIQV